MKNILYFLSKRSHFLSLFLFILTFSFGPTQTLAFSGGTGSEGSPYQIATCDDLQDIGSSSASSFLVTANLDCSEFGIFSIIPSFSGTLDGDNHTITGISIVNDAESGDIGLFGIVNGATIQNLQFVDFSLLNNHNNAAYIGAVAGLYNGGTLQHVSFENLTIDGNHNGGTGNYLGGVIGIADGVHLSKVQIIGNSSIIGNVYMGGLIGIANSDSGNLIIDNCAVNATVSSPDDFVGGFIGILDSHFGNNFSVTNSYQNGNVTGDVFVGAFFGVEDGGFGQESLRVVQNNFATGTATDGFANGGGFGVDYSNNYYTHTCDFGLCAGDQTLTDWYDSTSQAPLDQWDFDTIWMTQVGGLPILQFAPHAVTGLTAEASGATVSLNWINPLDGDFDSVMIRRSTSDYPTSVLEGTLVVSNKVGTSHSDAALDDGTYYYSIFSKNTEGSYSSAATATVLVDTTPPTVEITSLLPSDNNSPSNPITVTFNELVTGFSSDELTLDNATIRHFADVSTENESIYNFDLIPSAAGTVTVDIAGEVASDASGNGNTAADQFSYTYTVAPDTNQGSSGAGGGSRIIPESDLHSTLHSAAKEADGRNSGNGTSDSSSSEKTPDLEPFKDVIGHWCHDFVIKLYKMGAVQGRKPGKFYPNSPIKNAEILKAGLLAFGYQPDSKVPVNKKAWYLPFLRQARKEGFISGPYFPNANISHKDALSLLMKMAKKSATPKLPFLKNSLASMTRAETAQLIVVLMGL